MVHESAELRRQLHETGAVRVRVEVDTVRRTVDVSTRFEQVEVQRVPRDTVVSAVQAPWQQGDVHVVPVYAERIVTTRQLVLVEEIHLRRRVDTQPGTEEVLLRQERALIERRAADGSWAPALPDNGQPASADGST